MNSMWAPSACAFKALRHMEYRRRLLARSRWEWKLLLAAPRISVSRIIIQRDASRIWRNGFAAEMKIKKVASTDVIDFFFGCDVSWFLIEAAFEVP